MFYSIIFKDLRLYLNLSLLILNLSSLQKYNTKKQINAQFYNNFTNYKITLPKNKK